MTYFLSSPIVRFGLGGIVCAVLLLPGRSLLAQETEPGWRHFSSTKGDLPVPNEGNQQTSSTVFDIDGDRTNDFVITERTESPSVTWYRRSGDGWERYVVDHDPLHIEAGSTFHDVDGDGDLDFVAGGDGQSNKVWWWENPSPRFDPNTSWTRRLIKDSGANKHHDQIFGDVDGDGEAELVFWNQGERKLFVAEIPDNPRRSQPWDLSAIYEWGSDQMEQRGSYPGWKATNEHEGLAIHDIDGDGIDDIVGGGRWFKRTGPTSYIPQIIDASYPFTRSAVGQFIEGGRPEVILVAGDGSAPMMLYEWREGTWSARKLIDEVKDGHSIAVTDFDGDGRLDIFSAEMQLGENPRPRTLLLMGDGKGGFTERTIHTGFGLHEAQLADLDGDGDLDVLGKPYTWEAPRLDVWINEASN